MYYNFTETNVHVIVKEKTVHSINNTPTLALNFYILCYMDTTVCVITFKFCGKTVTLVWSLYKGNNTYIYLCICNFFQATDDLVHKIFSFL